MSVMGPSEIPLLDRDTTIESYNEALAFANLVKTDLEVKGTSGNFDDLKKSLASLQNIPEKLVSEFSNLTADLDAINRVIAILKSLGAVEPVGDEMVLTPPEGMDKMPQSSKKQPAKKHYLTKNKAK